MQRKSIRRIPILIASGVLLLLLILRLLAFDFFERLECVTYDLRARAALNFPAPCSTNFGFVYLDEKSISAVKSGELGYAFGLLWPRQVHGRLVRELAAEGAATIAFDILFGDERPDHPPVQMADGELVDSDEFLALQMRQASNVVLAVTEDIRPPPLLKTNAVALGDISTEKDSDGVLRRARAFETYRDWHPMFEMVQNDPDYGVDLSRAGIETNHVILPRREGEPVVIPLAQDGTFAIADFIGEDRPPGLPERALPFVDQRVWHMGLVIGARSLNIDLNQAEVDLVQGSITFTLGNGEKRLLPVDHRGYFYIDWCMPPNHPTLQLASIESFLQRNRARGMLAGRVERPARPQANRESASPGAWTGRHVIVGSAAIGNDLTDRGATPIRSDTLLVSKHWNVANSLVTGRFVRRTSTAVDLLLIAALGITVALLTSRLRVLVASAAVSLLILGYAMGAFWFYIQSRYWIPVVLPVIGAMLVMHVSLLVWQVLFEQADKRLLRSIFSTIVSPKIVNELLRTQNLSLGGARREVTVLFADVRGFTDFIEQGQERATQLIHERHLSAAVAEVYQENQAREALGTINAYLGMVADTVIKHDGTLDKFIGDCVMAFWGAPTSDPHHASLCVRAAVEAQRAIYSFNQERARENERRAALTSADRLDPLPLLDLGTGINTGIVTVGLMGSEAKTRNYTVFGREVNLASRLESQSGRSRILISQSTYDCLLRDDPELAATCISLSPVTVKGFRQPVPVFEVPWRL